MYTKTSCLTYKYGVKENELDTKCFVCSLKHDVIAYNQTKFYINIINDDTKSMYVHRSVISMSRRQNYFALIGKNTSKTVLPACKAETIIIANYQLKIINVKEIKLLKTKQVCIHFSVISRSRSPNFASVEKNYKVYKQIKFDLNIINGVK